jgi:hypothetical protein
VADVVLREDTDELDERYVKRPGNLLGPPIGTQFDTMFPLFERFENSNEVVDYADFEAREYSDMLDRDGKAKTIEAVLTLPQRMVSWSVRPREGDRKPSSSKRCSPDPRTLEA